MIPDGNQPLAQGSEQEAMWIDVIRKMDDVYADLLRSQAALEQKNEALQETQDFISSVLSSMTDILVACDAQGRVQQVNAALLALRGEGHDALIGQPLRHIFDPAERPAVAALLEDACAQRPMQPRELMLAVAGAQQAPVSVACAPRLDGAGRLVGLVIVGRPIGELQRAYRELDAAHQQLTQTQQQLLASEKMAALGRLVAGVAHELNNPISFVFGNVYALRRYGGAITGYLAAIDAGMAGEELARLRRELKIDRVLADIGPLVDGTLEGAERVRDIVQDLRRFSSSQQEARERFDVTRLIATAADWVVKARRHPLQVAFEMPDELEIVSRKGQLHQVLVNLIQNAADAISGRTEGLITVSAARRDTGGITVQVRDNGPGIPSGNRDKIFEPFFTTKPLGSGTGLGLYVSYNIAMKLGGRLYLQDPAGRGGAHFILEVPDDVWHD